MTKELCKLFFLFHTMKIVKYRNELVFFRRPLWTFIKLNRNVNVYKIILFFFIEIQSNNIPLQLYTFPETPLGGKNNHKLRLWCCIHRQQKK